MVHTPRSYRCNSFFHGEVWFSQANSAAPRRGNVTGFRVPVTNGGTTWTCPLAV